MHHRFSASALFLSVLYALPGVANAQSCGNAYDFNNLTGNDAAPFAQLHLQDNWTSESFGGVISCGVSATLGYDGSQALRFEQVGPGVGTDASRLNDGAYSIPTFSGSETSAFFQADLYVSFWGNSFAVGHDTDSNGQIRGSEAGERGPQLRVGSNNTTGLSLISAAGTINMVPLNAAGGAGGGNWLRLRVVMDLNANGGTGSGSVDFINLSAGGTDWAPVAGLQGIDLQLSPGSGNASDPVNWNGVWLHFEGATNQLDNIDVGLNACDVGTTYCFGDGSGTACPCANPGASGEGCANSTGAGGTLVTAGTNSFGNDDLQFAAGQLVPAQPVLLFTGLNQVNGGMGNLLGDGLRCAGIGVKRMGIRVPDGAGNASWGPGLATVGSYVAGDTRNFQCWYRDPGGSPCGSGFNLTNGVTVTFVP